MAAVVDVETHTVSVMAATQLVKTELLINVCGYYIHQDPSAIIFVQPTQGKAAEFSKERFAPTVEVSPALRKLVEPPKARDSENTITHKEFPGGVLNFVGANSPSDLASRPARIILCDEIDKYPPSAGSEGDPLKLVEERASTYRALGRAKFVRTCSPTVEGDSRIEREYKASDQRRLFVACPHCDFEQVLTWAHMRWDHDEAGVSLPDTAALRCQECGSIWTERERVSVLDALRTAPGYGWRQTAEFSCCGKKHTPSIWNDEGRSLCPLCEMQSPYAGHAGFHVSKLYSKRHRMPEVVQEFLEAKANASELQKWTNTALAELWKPADTESFSSASLIARAENYDGDDLPEAVKVITGFCDVQGDRLEIQLIGWGADEEAWPFQYTIINQDPAQPAAWQELDVLLRSKFYTTTGRVMRIAAFGIDTGGHHGAQVYSFCRSRRARRIFACQGFAGPKPVWPGRASRSKLNDPFYAVGVDTAKEQIYAALNITPPEPGMRKPGFIHFPTAENFGPEYFAQLNSERRQIHKRMGQSITRWVKIRDRNEALDTFVGALAVRRSLPRYIVDELEYSITLPSDDAKAAENMPAAVVHEAQRYQNVSEPIKSSWIGSKPGWMRPN